MKLLLLGFSNIARRRILPAARAAGFDAIDVASRSAASHNLTLLNVDAVYDDYESALDRSRADLVYVSNVNSIHGPLAEAALERGFHVVVDKPAFLSLSESSRLAGLALEKRLCLAEATVWQYHPRIHAAFEMFEEAGRAEHIVSSFSYPPMPEKDFRYNASLGGGALLDLGPYAMTPARLFFRSVPQSMAAFCTSFKGAAETAFSMAAIYPSGRSLVGSFGFTSGYINRMDIFGPGLAIGMDRVFSPPANLETEMEVSGLAGRRSIKFPAADTFAVFLQAVTKAIRDGDHASFTRALISDAETLDRLRESALAHNQGDRLTA